jgi:hypothetical protein
MLMELDPEVFLPFDPDEAERVAKDNAEERAQERITSSEGIGILNDDFNVYVNVTSDIARICRNLTQALAREKIGLDALLMACDNVRQAYLDAARQAEEA